MTDKTRDDLIAQALINLKVIGSGQSPDADDRAAVDVKIDGLLGELESRGIVSMPDDDAIAVEFFNPLAGTAGERMRGRLRDGQGCRDARGRRGAAAHPDAAAVAAAARDGPDFSGWCEAGGCLAAADRGGGIIAPIR